MCPYEVHVGQVQVHGEQHRGCVRRFSDDAPFGVNDDASPFADGAGAVDADNVHLVNDCIRPRKDKLQSPVRRRGLDNVEDNFGPHPGKLPDGFREPSVVTNVEPDTSGAIKVNHHKSIARIIRLVGPPREDLPIVSSEVSGRRDHNLGIEQFTPRTGLAKTPRHEPDTQSLSELPQLLHTWSVEGLRRGTKRFGSLLIGQSIAEEVELGKDHELRLWSCFKDFFGFFCKFPKRSSNKLGRSLDGCERDMSRQ